MALYNPVVRDFNSAVNGGMAYGNVNIGKAGSIDYKVFYGAIPMSPDMGVADFFNTTSLYTSAGVRDVGMDYSAGGQLFWNTPVDGLKVGYSYSFFKNLIATGKFVYVPTADVTLILPKYNYHTLSAEYIRGQWTFAAEWQHVEGDTKVVTPFSTSYGVSKTENWYVSVARRLNDKFEVGAYYASQQNKNPAATATDAQKHNRDWAFSIRYDINEHILVKAEYHYVDGRLNMFNTPRTPNPKMQDNTSLIAVKTTFSF
jgi:predicted porin